jgi:diguanylate cyclase (GGDEF)-like protein
MVQRRRHRKDGTTIPIDLAISPLLDASGEVEGFMTIAEDVSERHRLEEALRQAAHSDPMTGLANRRGFVEASGRELARAARTRTPLSFVLFDIDHFKQVNDRFGHSAGDRVLEAIAETMRNCLRASDLGVRWGGEELLAMLPDTDLEGARLLAERVRSAVARLAVAGAGPVTLSAGVAEWQVGEEIVSTLSRADERLYRAKADGRDRVA